MHKLVCTAYRKRIFVVGPSEAMHYADQWVYCKKPASWSKLQRVVRSTNPDGCIAVQ